MLNQKQHDDLLVLLQLIVEQSERPSENTHDRLVERSGLPQETVLWGLGVLWNQGDGWLDFVDHPSDPHIRGYFTNDRFDAGDEDINDLFERWEARQEDEETRSLSVFDEDDEDPDDEWGGGIYEE